MKSERIVDDVEKTTDDKIILNGFIFKTIPSRNYVALRLINDKNEIDIIYKKPSELNFNFETKPIWFKKNDTSIQIKINKAQV
jgi:hypothetical protein